MVLNEFCDEAPEEDRGPSTVNKVQPLFHPLCLFYLLKALSLPYYLPLIFFIVTVNRGLWASRLVDKSSLGLFLRLFSTINFLI